MEGANSTLTVPSVESWLDVAVAIATESQVMVVLGPVGYLGQYSHHDALGVVLDDLSDKFGVSLHAVQLVSCSGKPLLDGLSLRRLREHMLYGRSGWNYKSQRREAANHVCVQAGEHLANNVLARILGCSLELSLAETLGCMPVVHALAPFNPRGPTWTLRLVMSRATAQKTGFLGNRDFLLAITHSCTWRQLKQRLARELQEIHCRPQELLFAMKGHARVTPAQEFEKVCEMVPEGGKVSFRFRKHVGDASFFRVQRMPAADVSLQSMGLAFERQQPGIALRLAAQNVAVWRSSKQAATEPFIPGTNAVEWSTSGGIRVEQLPRLMFAKEPMLQVWPRQWLLQTLGCMRIAGLPHTARRYVVSFLALLPECWFRGPAVPGQTTFSWQPTRCGRDVLLASFVPTACLLPGVLSISTFGLKSASPSMGGQQEIRFQWLVMVASNSNKYAGPFPAFDAVGFDYGAGPVHNTLQPAILPAAWMQ